MVKKKILIVDDHLVVRTGVALLLKAKMDNLEIFNAQNFFETRAILKDQIFDLVILDINIPGGKGVEMIQELRSIQPAVKIMMFSAHEEEQYASRYILSGANGYLNKLCSEEKMILAVTSILESGTYIPNEIAHKIAEAGFNKTAVNPFDTLSKRELEIVKLLIDGNGNLEICNKLNIHMSTVSTYKVRVFEKLKINNLVELINIHKIHG